MSASLFDEIAMLVATMPLMGWLAWRWRVAVGVPGAAVSAIDPRQIRSTKVYRTN
jgi:hypothetical protein